MKLYDISTGFFLPELTEDGVPVVLLKLIITLLIYKQPF